MVSEIDLLPTLFQTKKFQSKISIGVTDSLPQEHKQQFFRKSSSLLKSVEWEVKGIGRECELNLLVREWKFEEDLFLPLWKEDYVLCIPDGHRLLEKSVITLEDLKTETFIHCPVCEAHQQCLSILNIEGERIRTIANCSTKTETLTMVMAGLGITFLPEWFVDGWYGFQIKPFDGPRYFREVGLAYSRKSLKNPAVAMLIDYFSKNELKTNAFKDFGAYKK